MRLTAHKLPTEKGPRRSCCYPCLQSPFGRLNASCCEISTRMARLFDLTLKNFASCEVYARMLRDDPALPECVDCFKMISQVTNVGPMWAAVRTS